MRLPIAILLLVLGCGASEEEVQAEFDAFVESHSECEVVAECASFSPGCPLGCAAYVRADALDEAMDLASDLVDDYERGGVMCDYGCVGSMGVACIEGRCTECPDADAGATGAACAD